MASLSIILRHPSFILSVFICIRSWKEILGRHIKQDRFTAMADAGENKKAASGQNPGQPGQKSPGPESAPPPVDSFTKSDLESKKEEMRAKAREKERRIHTRCRQPLDRWIIAAVSFWLLSIIFFYWSDVLSYILGILALVFSIVSCGCCCGCNDKNPGHCDCICEDPPETDVESASPSDKLLHTQNSMQDTNSHSHEQKATDAGSVKQYQFKTDTPQGTAYVQGRYAALSQSYV